MLLSTIIPSIPTTYFCSMQSKEERSLGKKTKEITQLHSYHTMKEGIRIISVNTLIFAVKDLHRILELQVKITARNQDDDDEGDDKNEVVNEVVSEQRRSFPVFLIMSQDK